MLARKISASSGASAGRIRPQAGGARGHGYASSARTPLFSPPPCAERGRGWGLVAQCRAVDIRTGTRRDARPRLCPHKGRGRNPGCVRGNAVVRPTRSSRDLPGGAVLGVLEHDAHRRSSSRMRSDSAKFFALRAACASSDQGSSTLAASTPATLRLQLRSNCSGRLSSCRIGRETAASRTALTIIVSSWRSRSPARLRFASRCNSAIATRRVKIVSKAHLRAWLSDGCTVSSDASPTA